jgi:hypothetical protein
MLPNVKRDSLKRLFHELKRSLVILSFLLVASPATAEYLDIIDVNQLTPEARILLTQVREVEPYVDEWLATWSHSRAKEEVTARIKEHYDSSKTLLAKNTDNAEIYLLCGLIAFYAHNVDLGDSEEQADTYFAAASKLCPNDFRPLWLLGMHLAKSRRCVEGMKSLLGAEGKQSIREPRFWEDYALAAYFTSMFGHALQALERVRELSGKKSRLDNAIGDKIRAVAKTPQPGEKIQARDLWQSSTAGTALRIVSFPLDYKLLVKKRKNQYLRNTDFDGRYAMLQVGLTPQTGAEGMKRIPMLHIMTFTASEQESLEKITKPFLNNKLKWRKYDLGLGLNEVSCMGAGSQFYKRDGGIRIVMVAFERDAPKISRLALEEPEAEIEGAGAGYYQLSGFYQRFERRLFYVLWLETPELFFDKSLVEFKDILKTLIIE